jgi:hypothetical protein
MDFLGHVLFQEGVRPDPKKIKLIKEWQSLVLIKRVSSFLGLVNFYKKFIKDFFALVRSFIDLLKKGGSFEWKDEQQSAFNFLKGKLLLTLVLRFLDFVKPFEVHMDANGFAISGVLMQEKHPIAFESKNLAGA